MLIAAIVAALCIRGALTPLAANISARLSVLYLRAIAQVERLIQWWVARCLALDKLQADHVADAAYCFDDLRICGAVAEFFAEPCDFNIDSAWCGYVVLGFNRLP